MTTPSKIGLLMVFVLIPTFVRSVDEDRSNDETDVRKTLSTYAESWNKQPWS